ncbi:MAG: MmgE/PrpD family protein [Verrucomicrobia bacterium]|nr:MmgE/PrpD family protein [Verrucomicrobiota bacterium]
MFADWFANAAAGFTSPLSQALLSLSPVYDGPGRALRVGDLKSVEPLWAALANAGASHSLEFDDSFRAGLYHPGAPVLSAAFASACRAEAPGTELLTALVAGYEISLRLAAAVNPGHYKIWHTTGTVGAFGAAAAAARTLGLNPRQTAFAFGMAGTQAAGLWEVLPDAPQAKNLHPGKAAQAGLLAALLSRQGIEGPLTIFEGKQGFFSAMVPEPVETRKCTAGLGEEWLTPTTTFKNYPVCGHTMTSIEACLKLHGRFALEEVEEIEVRAHPVSLQVAGRSFPADEYQAKFSIPYCVAVALLKGRVGQEEFSRELRESGEVNDLLKRIKLAPDDGLGGAPGQRPARVTLRVSGGKTFTASAAVRKGDPELPMTPDEKRDKFLKLTGPVWGDGAAKRVLESIQELPGKQNVLLWAEGLRKL